ncbi:hypothetical protein PGT21_016241 [Puccinia graminis f. sp. tritici]|uniref:Uncharacterized protein n=1 Tax=Puccinia graminis f. sp. tritici TaxID=56615 RepID=A0A5B0PEV0_PUCGR|nr:hypothetical protein PGT21_016241 [Puccinia graminis f. sp. tritici]
MVQDVGIEAPSSAVIDLPRPRMPEACLLSLDLPLSKPGQAAATRSTAYMHQHGVANPDQPSLRAPRLSSGGKTRGSVLFQPAG